MENLNSVCKIDDQGRISLPPEFMKALGWGKRDTLLLTYAMQDDTAVLRMAEKSIGPKCVFCKMAQSKIYFSGCDICVNCFDRIRLM